MKNKNELKKKLDEIKKKLDLIVKQEWTPERGDEITNLIYEKDQLEWEIYGKNSDTTKHNKYKIKKAGISEIAKKVKSIKGLIRL
jgi:hypothetical protein